jgi:hypothetical protein
MKRSAVVTISAIIVGGTVGGLLALASPDNSAWRAAATAIGISAAAVVWRRFEEPRAVG